MKELMNERLPGRLSECEERREDVDREKEKTRGQERGWRKWNKIKSKKKGREASTAGHGRRLVRDRRLFARRTGGVEASSKESCAYRQKRKKGW